MSITEELRCPECGESFVEEIEEGNTDEYVIMCPYCRYYQHVVNGEIKSHSKTFDEIFGIPA